MSHWMQQQLLTISLTVLGMWVLFMLIIHYRGNQTWSAAALKGFLLSIQSGLAVGTFFFCCMEVHESPMHQQYSLVKRPSEFS